MFTCKNIRTFWDAYKAMKKLNFFLSVILICVQISNTMDRFLPDSNIVFSDKKAGVVSLLCGSLVAVLGISRCGRDIDAQSASFIVGGSVAAGMVTALGSYFFMRESLHPAKQYEKGVDRLQSLREDSIFGWLQLQPTLNKSDKNIEQINVEFIDFVADRQISSHLVLRDQLENLVNALSYEKKRAEGMVAHVLEENKKTSQEMRLLQETQDSKKAISRVLIFLKSSDFYHHAYVRQLEETKLNWDTKLNHLLRILALPAVATIILALAQYMIDKCGLSIELPSLTSPINIILPQELFGSG
jgi:hypothetical protein